MCIHSEREETSVFLCFCQEMHGTCEKKDTVVMLLCALMSGQFDHGKRRYAQRFKHAVHALNLGGWMDGQIKKDC